MGGSSAARRETENRTSKYKTIKVCILCTVVVSSVMFVIVREARSAGVDITERGSLLSLFQHTMSNPRAKRHHKQTHSAKPTAAITNQPTTAMSPDTNSLNVEEDEIGRVDQEHCQHCESLIGEEVCGANGKTYISLCHAVNCAGLRESDIIAGRCVTEVN